MQSEASDRGIARPVLCTSLCTNGGQRVDDVGNPGGNEEVQGITLCFSKYLLTRDYATSLLVFVPESARRPGGEDRASARGCIAREEQRNRDTDSVHGHLGPGCRTPSRGRRQRRVGERHGKPGRASGQTGPTSPSGGGGNGDLLDRSEGTGQPAAGEWCGEATGHARRLRAHFGAQRGAGQATESWEEPKELGPPQLDSARSVPIGTRTEGLGNRVSVKRCRRVRGRETGVESDTRHRPPRRKARRAM